MHKRNKKLLWLVVGPGLLIIALKFYQKSRHPPLLPGIGGYPTAIAFSPDGKVIVCASNNSLLQKWMPDLQKWRSFSSAVNYMTNVRPVYSRVHFSKNGQAIYAGGSATDQSYSSVAHVWDVEKRNRKFAFNYLKSTAFDVSPDDHWAALGYFKFIQLVDLHGKPASLSKTYVADHPDYLLLPYKKLPVPGQIGCVAFSPDGKTLAVGGLGWTSPLELYDVATGKRKQALDAKQVRGASTSGGSLGANQVFFLEWSPDSQRLAMIGGGMISILDVTTTSTIEVNWPSGQIPYSWDMVVAPETIACLAWSPDGKWLFSGGDEIRQWDAKDLKLIRSFKSKGPVAISPDGKTIAMASQPDMGEASGLRMVPF